jgi:hypothetical protein
MPSDPAVLDLLTVVVIALGLAVATLLLVERHSGAEQRTPCEAWLLQLLADAPERGVSVRRARVLAASAGFDHLEFERSLSRLIGHGVVTRIKGTTEPTIGEARSS